MTEYHNFWLRIENRADGLYVRADSTAGGSVAAPLELPEGLDVDALSRLLTTSGGSARGAGEAKRDLVLEGDEAPTSGLDEEVGSELFHALFPGPVRDAFMRNVGSGKENGVRVRIQIDPTDPALVRLAGLPWELLYNDVTDQSLGRSKFTPIVRSFDVAQPYVALPFELPLRVLLVLANPTGTHALALDREKERVVEILHAIEGVEVDVLERATKAALYDRLDTTEYHVLHYMGHGGFDPDQGGVLILEDEAGRPEPLSAEMLGDDLAERRAMRLVFLNACDTGRTGHEAGTDPFTGVASALVAAGIPAVVAMQVPIADRAAFAFAEKAYTMVAQGEPVDAAVAVGRRAIYREDPASLEWATPVLFMRSDDGHLFRPSETADEPEAAAPVAPPPAVPPSAPPARGGSKGLRWAGIGAAAVVGLLALWFLLMRGEPAAEAAPNDVLTLLQTNGFDTADDPFLRSVAQRMVDDRAEMVLAGYDPLVEQVQMQAEDRVEPRSVTVEPGVEYLVRGYGDDACDRLGLTVRDDARRVLGDESGARPSVQVPGAAGTVVYQAETVLEACRDGEGFVGLSVFARALPSEPAAPAAALSPEVQDLLYEFGDPSAPDPEFLRVARRLVNDRATAVHKGFERVYEAVLLVRAGETHREPMLGEPSFAYLALASCDGACDELAISLLNDDTRVAQDTSKTPGFRATTPALIEGSYAIEVALNDCSADACYVGVGVYCKAPGAGPGPETEPPPAGAPVETGAP